MAKIARRSVASNPSSLRPYSSSPSSIPIKASTGNSINSPPTANSIPTPTDSLRGGINQLTTRTISNFNKNYENSSTIQATNSTVSSHSSTNFIYSNNTNKTPTVPTSALFATSTFASSINSTIFYADFSNTTKEEIIAAERERVRMEFYATYDVMTGVRIAATLGGFFSLMVFLIVWKSRSHTDETLRVLKDPKIAAATVACMQEEEERKIQEAMEATGLSIYPDEYDAMLFRRQRMLSLGNVSAPPVLHRGFRFSSVGGGYSSLLQPPRRFSYTAGRRTSASESSRVLSNYQMGSSFGTDDYFIETDDEIDNGNYANGRAEPSQHHVHLMVPPSGQDTRRSSAMTCCSTESSYLERRSSAYTLGLSNLPPSLRRKLSTTSRVSSTDLWDYYYPDIQIIQATPRTSPCPSERNLYGDVKKQSPSKSKSKSIGRKSSGSSHLVRKQSIAYYDPESAQSGKRQRIHSISAETSDFFPYAQQSQYQHNAAKPVALAQFQQQNERYDDRSELKLIVKRKISDPSNVSNNIMNNNNVTSLTRYGDADLNVGAASVSSEMPEPTVDLGEVSGEKISGTVIDIATSINAASVSTKRAPLASLSSFKISSLDFQDSELRSSLDYDSVFADSIADTDDDLEQFSTDSDEISIEDDGPKEGQSYQTKVQVSTQRVQQHKIEPLPSVVQMVTPTTTSTTVVTTIPHSMESKATTSMTKSIQVQQQPIVQILPEIVKRLNSVSSLNCNSSNKRNRPSLERHRTISNEASCEQVNLISSDYPMQQLTKNETIARHQNDLSETHFFTTPNVVRSIPLSHDVPTVKSASSSPLIPRKSSLATSHYRDRGLLQQQISDPQSLPTTTDDTETPETCSTLNTEIVQDVMPTSSCIKNFVSFSRDNNNDSSLSSCSSSSVSGIEPQANIRLKKLGKIKELKHLTTSIDESSNIPTNTKTKNHQKFQNISGYGDANDSSSISDSCKNNTENKKTVEVNVIIENHPKAGGSSSSSGSKNFSKSGMKTSPTVKKNVADTSTLVMLELPVINKPTDNEIDSDDTNESNDESKDPNFQGSSSRKWSRETLF